MLSTKYTKILHEENFQINSFKRILALLFMKHSLHNI